MKKLFICLANSKKYGERCVAGVEVERNEKGGFKVVRKENKPKWIRPVTDSQHGAVPETLVGKMKLLEVYEIDVIEECSDGYQSENVKFMASSLKKISRIGDKSSNIDHLIESSRYAIFSNRGKAVIKDQIAEIDHSLVLVKAVNPEVYFNTSHDKKQLRIKFKYKNSHYDLPITDTMFLSDYHENDQKVSGANEVYITISLGVEYEGWHYKLAAGIICI